MSQSPQRERYEWLDTLRGFAMVWMALFHFAFDLNYLKVVHLSNNFHADPAWTPQRTVILSLFLFCAGLGQAVALAQGQGWPSFWRRWAQIAACAVGVSIGSWLMFPRSWIFFGVLHGMAVMLILTRWLGQRSPGAWLALAVGLVAIALPALWRHPDMAHPALQWLGLAPRKPITEDWVPLLPWWGVMLCGLAAGRLLLARRPAWLAGRPTGALQGLARLGRWSLGFYMLHQPVLMGALMGGRAIGLW